MADVVEPSAVLEKLVSECRAAKVAKSAKKNVVKQKEDQKQKGAATAQRQRSQEDACTTKAAAALVAKPQPTEPEELAMYAAAMRAMLKVELGKGQQREKAIKRMQRTEAELLEKVGRLEKVLKKKEAELQQRNTLNTRLKASVKDMEKRLSPRSPRSSSKLRRTVTQG